MKRHARTIAGLALLLMPLAGFAQKQVTATTPLWIQFIAATERDPNGQVPAFNKVPGAGVLNVDLGFPASILNHGSVYVYSMIMQDLNFTGTCQASFKLTQVQAGKTVTLDSGVGPNFPCGPTVTGGGWGWFWTGKPIPSSPGLATLTAIAKYGTKTVTLSSPVVLN
jgi:hypothetical protein